jgi:hypothetical protein
VYLKPLIDDRGWLTVYDARSGHAVFWADESSVRELTRAKKIKPEGPRKCIKRLLWVGREISTIRVIEQQTGETGVPSPARGPKKYSHNRERTSTEERYVTPFDENLQGVWTMVRLPDSTQIVFLAVAAQCGARIFKRSSNMGAKPSRQIPDAWCAPSRLRAA